MVLKRISRPKSDEVTGEWRKLHSEELHNLYSSPDIIRQIKSRRMRWESQKERDHSEDKGIGGRMGSEWILRKLACGVWIGFDWLRIGTGGGLL
jgi:hypothetical protein